MISDVDSQAEKGDEETAQLLKQLSSEMNNTEPNNQQLQILQEQEQKQADLDAKQREEDRQMDRLLQDEFHKEQREADDLIEQQKKLVGIFHLLVHSIIKYLP